MLLLVSLRPCSTGVLALAGACAVASVPAVVGILVLLVFFLLLAHVTYAIAGILASLLNWPSFSY